MTGHLWPLSNHRELVAGGEGVPGGRLMSTTPTMVHQQQLCLPLEGMVLAPSAAPGSEFYCCRLCRGRVRGAGDTEGVCAVSPRAAEQSVGSCPGRRGLGHRAVTRDLSRGSVRTKVSSHCKFCSASHPAEGLARKYRAVGRQDPAADACWVLASGCSLQEAASESCFFPPSS